MAATLHPVIIRPAIAGDRPELAAMHVEFADFLDRVDPQGWADKPSPEHLWITSGLSFAADPVCRTLFAERDRQVLGFLTYFYGCWEAFATLYVADLYIRESARGEGLGHQLMHHARDLAAAKGITHMAWFCWRKNAPALAFYEGLGAEPKDEDVLLVWPVAPSAAVLPDKPATPR